MAAESFDHKHLLDLARDKSREGRATLIDAIKDLYEGTENVLSDRDRDLIGEILKNLVHEVETSVRWALAMFLADKADAPDEIVFELANDEIDVAYPILSRSEVLKDPELVEIIAHRTMEHQLAITVRPGLSEEVSDALIEAGGEEVMTSLLRNRSASISDAGMGRLVDMAAETESVQKPLVEREDLPDHIAAKLYWGVSAALRKHLVRQYGFDPAELDAKMEQVIRLIMARDEAEKQRIEDEADEAGENETGRVSHFTQLLKRGEISQFIHVFSKMTGLRPTLLRRFLFEPGGQGLAIACKSVDLPKSDFATTFIMFRQGRLGQNLVESDEVNEALAFFDRVKPAEARLVVERWTRDPDYLNALRMIEPGAGSAAA